MCNDIFCGKALFRLGSGVFIDGYKVGLIKKDESKYSVASIGDYQVEETCSDTISKRFVRSPIIIYEFEACPFCRKVREAVSILSLDVTFRPCPKNGYTFREEIKSKYGPKSTFPFMIDPNTGIELFESDQIIEYLFRAYADDVIPSSLTGGVSTALTAGLGLLPRLGTGGSSKPSNKPEQPLVRLYFFHRYTSLLIMIHCILLLFHTSVFFGGGRETDKSY